MGANYSHPNQTERLISTGRVILAAFALFAIWLDPAEPARHALTEMNQGPVILRERVASLGGSLTIESGETGTRLEIALPIMEKGGLR